MKNLVIPFLFSVFVILSSCEQKQVDTITVRVQDGKDTISRHIYGHFAEHLGRCIYDGFWVGLDSPVPNTRGIRNDVVQAFREIGIPNLRWPGGCFADQYHWMNGIGDPATRNKTVNVTWGGVMDDNSFGTHEFMDLCEQLGCEPVICGNIGSGSVEEMAKWVEYLTSDAPTPLVELRRKNGREKPWKVKYWGVGNETWGCGGIMNKEFYSEMLRKYSFFLNNYNNNVLYKIASGSHDSDYDWTGYIVKQWSETDGWLQAYMNGISLHYYTIANTWASKGSATDFTSDEWFSTISATLKMDEFINGHIAAIEKYDPDNRIGLIVDEWGDWFDPEPGSNPAFLYQQNTLRDAIVASLNLNIFNAHCSRVKMANIAQAVNVLHAMVLTRDDKMVKTPSFYVFKMYKVHHDALMLPLDIRCRPYENNGKSVPSLSASASKDKTGKINITITNVDPESGVNTRLIIDDSSTYTVEHAEIITADHMNALNNFDTDEAVTINPFKDVSQKGNEIQVNMPSKSVVLITLGKK